MSSRTQSSRLARLPQRRAALGGAAAFAEQPLEHDARMRLGRQRRRRRRPRQVVLVDARVAVVALPDRLQQVHRQLERRQLRLAARSAARRSDRRSCPGSSRVLSVHFAFAALRNAAFDVACVPGIRVLQLEVAEHRELIRRPAPATAASATARSARPRPAASTAAGRIPSACRRSRGAAPGSAGVCASAVIDGTIASSSGSATRRAHAAQERPPRQCLLGDDHRDILI